MITGHCAVCGRETYHTIYHGAYRIFVCATYEQEKIGISSFDTCKRFAAEVMEEHGHSLFFGKLHDKLDQHRPEQINRINDAIKQCPEKEQT